MVRTSEKRVKRGGQQGQKKRKIRRKFYAYLMILSHGGDYFSARQARTRKKGNREENRMKRTVQGKLVLKGGIGIIIRIKEEVEQCNTRDWKKKRREEGKGVEKSPTTP